jgi:hypothetical protein
MISKTILELVLLKLKLKSIVKLKLISQEIKGKIYSRNKKILL